jgi:multiple sugar transport system permease protein
MTTRESLPVETTAAGAKRRARRGVRQIMQDRTKLAFLLPAAIWVLAFTIFPTLYAVYLTVWNVRLGKAWIFVGLKNFARLAGDANLQNAFKITLTFVASTVIVEMILGFLLALLLNREIWGQRFWRAVMILPLFATPAAMGFLGITMFYEEGGPINSLLGSLFGWHIPWLSHPFYAFLAIIIVDVWQWTPFVSLVALAGLQSLPVEVYEAADVDGASGWQKFWALTLPLMQPILVIVLLLRLIEAFKVFDIPTSMTLGGPGRATEVYSLFAYRTGLQFFDLGYAAVQGLVLLVVVLIIVSNLFGRMREAYA